MEKQESQSKRTPINEEDQALYNEFHTRDHISKALQLNINKPRVGKRSYLSEIPLEVIWRLLELSEKREPDIAFAICLQAVTGIRTGEVVNIRQVNCPIGGAGYTYTMEEGKMTSFAINLKHNVEMRSDGVDVGKIKSPREHIVCNGFLPILQRYHDLHMERLQSKTIEEGYYPLFVDKNGKALTVRSYQRKFDRLASYLIRDLKESGKLELATILSNNRLTPNLLRTWFTYQLVEIGLPPRLVALYRGDKTLDIVYSFFESTLKASRVEELKKQFLPEEFLLD